MAEHRERYAVVFRESDGPAACGRLEVADDRLLLSGGKAGRHVDLSIPLADIGGVHIGRRQAERLNGFRTIVLERAAGPPVQLAPLGIGLLHEITDLLSALTATHEGGDELAIVVPLKPGCIARARNLLALGPPLDPAELGLTAHQVYLREDAAVFVFAGPRVRERVREAMRSPALWRAGMAWQRCIAGRPEVSEVPEILATEFELHYSWTSDKATGKHKS